MAKIYTKKGDDGYTNLVGTRVQKKKKIFQTLGMIDEINSMLGLCYALSTEADFTNIQKLLMNISSNLAGYKKDLNLEQEIKTLEQEIDEITAKIPPLAAFVLTGGSVCGATVHLTRAKVRLLEQHLFKEKTKTPKDILKFFNRLSDYLFTYARYINFLEKKEEKKLNESSN